ncbi:MAG: PilN domain-containing protein [bacterium]
MGPNNMPGMSPEFANTKNSDFNNIGFSDKPSSVVITSWIAIGVAVLVTVAFWLLDSSTMSSYKTKQKQKDQVISSITSSDFAEIDQKVSGFKAAYDEMKKASVDKFVMSDFLDLLYGAINTDVSIRNISITSDGKLNIDGVAQSYRSVSDQMLSLKSLSTLQNVQLLSTSMSTSSSGKTEVPFVFSAEIVAASTQDIVTNPTISNNSSEMSTNDNSNSNLGSSLNDLGGTDATQ